MIYAGIGSRKTPPDMLEYMTRIAKYLTSLGYTLVSGGAEGADQAFEKGAGRSIIFKPQCATKEAISYASKFHPNWKACSAFARQAHGRNAMIILGAQLECPVNFVICWTPSGQAVGGTALGIAIAKANKIPVFNLAVKEDVERIKKKVR
jgi:hypothetical protein